MKFGESDAAADRGLADFKATEARHADTCQPHPLGLRHPVEVPCPCGDAVALCCPACGQPVWVAADPARDEPCKHAVELYENGAQ